MRLRKVLPAAKRRFAELAARISETGCAILMYHRINEGGNDPWDLCVSPHNFAGHLQAIRNAGFETVTVAELARVCAAGRRPHRMLAVSFDDGYADNLLHGHPLLREHDVPATIFVTSGYVGAEREFWWDALERIFLRPGRLPSELMLDFGAAGGRYDLGSAEFYTLADFDRHIEWRGCQPPPTARHEVFLAVWSVLSTLPDGERDVALDHLTAWAGVSDAPRETHRALSEEELQCLARDDQIEIGAHTVSHPRLAALSLEQQKYELAESRRRLQEIVGKPIAGCSYPNGSIPTQSLVAASGYSYACTSRYRPLRRAESSMCLPRMVVPNLDPERFDGEILDRIRLRRKSRISASV